MCKALDGLSLRIDSILVDGDRFIGYKRIPYTCFVGGDDQYASIAAASIIAKVYHDQYVEKLLDDDPDLEKYGWRTNMCYGTAKHMWGIRRYGITQWHRKSFGICKDSKVIDII